MSSVPPNPHVIVMIGSTRYDSWIKPGPIAQQGAGLISQVAIDLTSDQTSEATVTITDDDFTFTDHHLASDGMKYLRAQFWMGFGSNLGAPLFTGTLVETESNGALATFRFHDQSNKMKQEKKSRYHNKASYISILRKLAEEHGLKFVGPSGADEGEVHDALVQLSETDWEFGRRIARRAGLKIWVSGDTLFAREAGHVGSPIASLAFRRDCRLLEGTTFGHKLPEHPRGRPRRVEMRVRGRAGSRLTGQSDVSSRGTTHSVVTEDLPTRSVAGAKHRARAKKDSQREHAFEHTISLLPDYSGPRINVRDTVELVRAGKLYSGLHIVGRIHCEATPGELKTDLQVFRDTL